MNLYNKFPHKRNTNVTCGATIYRIGDGGFIIDGEGEPLDIPEEHASRLLQGKAWRELDWDPKETKNAARFATHNVPKGKGVGRQPRSRAQMEADYGATMEKPGELIKGRVDPAAAQLDDEGRKALRVTSDQGPISGERLERLSKADQVMANESLKGAAGDPEADAIAAATAGSMPTGSAEVGDGRKPGAQTPAVEVTTFTGKSGTVYTEPTDGDWPDPTGDMPMPYLREMAKGYEVKHNKRTTRKTLTKHINEAMYPENLE